MTDPAQLAMITAGTTLLSGTIAAALGQNAAGAVNAAANETLNNACAHACGEDENDKVTPVRLTPQSGEHEEVHTEPGTGAETVTETVGGLPLASALAGAKTNSSIKLVEQDGNIYQFSIPGSNGDLSVVTEMTQSGNQLILNGMHIDGPGAGSSSLGQLRNIARALGQQYGVDEVVINGGTRTSGANPGKGANVKSGV